MSPKTYGQMCSYKGKGKRQKKEKIEELQTWNKKRNLDIKILHQREVDLVHI